MSGLTFDLPPEVVDQIATLAAEKVLDQMGGAESEDRWLRGYAAIADYIDAPLSRVKSLGSLGRLPVERDGRAVIARTSALDAWIKTGGGKRP